MLLYFVYDCNTEISATVPPKGRNCRTTSGYNPYRQIFS
ncbi:conserved protein of unknown function [Limnospira indica PCC 8005]|uniref:Uncharacterized protein n=1 Tax=Limnospira indica PCC 8005 TaxID=376219 RepID=A0A9P1KBY7_9CYAN|nr:conserved protein of unknown function [Limnospira indica PCC 8005]